MYVWCGAFNLKCCGGYISVVSILEETLSTLVSRPKERKSYSIFSIFLEAWHLSAFINTVSWKKNKIWYQQ